MSTRSMISVKVKKGLYKTVYCHFDGYISWNGKILLNYYNRLDAVLDLIALGNLSSLDKYITCPIYHSWDRNVDDYSVFYGRDRGYKDEQCKVFKTEKALKQSINWDIDYHYLFKNDKWYIDGQRLTQKLIEESK